MQADPENAAAVAGIAECMIAVGQYERASELLSSLSEELTKDAAVQAASKKLAQFEEARKLGDPLALQQALQLNPDDHASRLKLAKILNAQGKREEAVEELLTIMRKDRTFEDDRRAQAAGGVFRDLGF